MRNVEPSQEDIDRFSENETGFCTKCGDEIWDGIDQCPSCGEWLETGVSHRKPIHNDMRKRLLIVLVVLILLGFMWTYGRLF